VKVLRSERVTVVRSSVEFRDAVFALAHDGREAYVCQEDFTGPVYQIIYGTGAKFTLTDFFMGNPPVHLEDFATALVPFGDKAPPMKVFTLKVRET
jgi:hypothetical protein